MTRPGIQRIGALVLLATLCNLLPILTANAQSSIVAAEARPDAGTHSLAGSEPMTVRALIAFDLLPRETMKTLVDLRGRGIDLLGATSDTLEDLLAHSPTLTGTDRQAIQQILSSLHAAQIGMTQAQSLPEADQPVPVSGRPAPPSLPPMSLPPALPMVELGSAQYAGLITTAKEATRTLMGEISAEETQKFEQRWAAYYGHPSAEIMDYFRQATPLLSEFLNVREAFAATSAAFDDAWEEAVLAAEYESEDGTDAALAQADMLKQYLQALEARATVLAQKLAEIGEAPDPVQLKEAARARHLSAMEVLQSLLPQPAPAEGVWVGVTEYDEDGFIQGVRGNPVLFVVYAPGPPDAPDYRALFLHADADDTAHAYVGIFGLTGDSPDMVELLETIHEDSLRHVYEVVYSAEEKDIVTLSASRAPSGERIVYPQSVALEMIEAAFAATRTEQIRERTELESTNNQRGDMLAGLSMFERGALSEMDRIRRHHAWTPAFVQASGQWLRERPFSEKTTLAQDRQALSDLVARILGPLQDPSQLIAQQSENATEPEPTPDRSAEEAEEAHRRERIAFHRQNILIIERTLARDQTELSRETDPERRKALEFRVVGALTDLQGEKDLIASIQTGENVRTRTAFDDYAHAAFVANIHQSQQEIVRFQRACDGLFKLAGMLPGEDGAKAREFVERQLSADVLHNLDHAAVQRIAEALGKQVEGHYLARQAQSEEEAAWAGLGLEAAQNVKAGADTGMMVLSLFGGRHVDLAYQAATGYIEGGPAEAVLRTATRLGTTASAAAEAMRGYRAGGLGEAVKRGTISFATSKALEYGMSKILGGGGPQRDAKTGAGVKPKPGPAAKPQGPGQTVARPMTPVEKQALEQFKRARKDGEAMVRDFRQAQKRLTEAGAAGRPASEIMALQAQVRNQAAAINGNPHAKNFLKYKGDALSQRAYNAHLRAVHADVEARFHANMQARGWNQQPLKEFRNSASAGSVGMDFDIGLNEAMARNLTRGGKPAKLHQWQVEAQQAWNDAYRSSTGRNASQAWETVTTSIHAESYKDLAWLSKDKTGLSRAWGQQAADVTRYKTWHMLNDPNLSRMEQLQEISRGAAKDFDTKVRPLMSRVTPTAANRDKFSKAQEHWEQVFTVLTDFGNNTIDPVTADRRIRELTAGQSIPDVVENMATMMEGLVKFGAGS